MKSLRLGSDSFEVIVMTMFLVLTMVVFVGSVVVVIVEPHSTIAMTGVIVTGGLPLGVTLGMVSLAVSAAWRQLQLWWRARSHWPDDSADCPDACELCAYKRRNLLPKAIVR